MRIVEGMRYYQIRYFQIETAKNLKNEGEKS